jgi:hypothetical protein
MRLLVHASGLIVMLVFLFKFKVLTRKKRGRPTQSTTGNCSISVSFIHPQPLEQKVWTLKKYLFSLKVGFSTRLFLRSFELGPPKPSHQQAMVSPPRLVPGGGTNSLGGEGGRAGRSQCGRRNRYCGTLGTVSVYCTLWANPNRNAAADKFKRLRKVH